MELKEFQQNFDGRYPRKEFVFLNAFQHEMKDYAQGFCLIVDDKSGLESWSDDEEFLNQLMPFAQANGSGSFYALWDEDKGKELNEMPIIVFGDEGGAHVVAENILELMHLLSYDTEISVDREEAYFYKDEDDYEESEYAEAYKDWLKEHFMLDPIEDPDSIIKQAKEKYDGPFYKWINEFLADEIYDIQYLEQKRNRRSKQFDIISFTADNKQYYPASMKRETWMKDNHVKHADITISMGQSRYGGPVIDLPPGVEHPENLQFTAQLDLSMFSPFDKTGLLPKTGQLIFFTDLLNDEMEVIYADVPNDKLVRIIKEHEDHFFTGVLIDKIFADTETLGERFEEPANEEESVNEDGKIWNYFAGSDKSKIFGIFTNCQCGEDEIEEITFSEKLILLQIGENGFNDEGVFSVLITKKDLKNKNFANCTFEWGQS
jgi:uncharacterized protein YwqG